jgi:NAD-dependent dihydropyrimidine dehydrogenase PreA subunit
MPKPKIDYKKCNNSGVCIDVCPVNVYEKENGKTVVKRPQDCIGCRACEMQCPKKAIKIED